MSDKTIAEIAEEVSLLLQLDRTRHQVSSKVDMAVLANIPAHIASTFEKANAIGTELSPNQAYDLINKRVSEIQAQVYLMRLELENRDPHDPANIYADPMVISAYGERLEGMIAQPKSFTFGPEILAEGWYSREMSGESSHRWMRPADMSLACVPHLGTLAQTLEIQGYVVHAEQLEGLSIRAAGKEAKIAVTPSGNAAQFTATLTLDAKDVKSANYLPVEFRMSSFKKPNEQDSRLLGANINRFTCKSLQEAADASTS
ncbi:hypothetical protein AQS8620_02840 [Aquimixticola soesokkakensis]|uniref:Uncharacterized protein n=1 Tax=Aquimixticola soesokkakensis TaxID=1519096 RepID=A0A1Y5TFF5_9RHOB|nr:hypothetical protein [Aquimixticola soesokkakensis]SLN62585.1 hypothetical protein AQS8620_02840 [Aquimixticola soesokkakensis]